LILIEIRVPEELGGSSFATAGDPLSPENTQQSHEQNLKIKHDRAVVNVPDIVPKPVLPRQLIPTVYLRPARYSGAHFVSASLLK
jgi:hypothetical protein